MNVKLSEKELQYIVDSLNITIADGAWEKKDVQPLVDRLTDVKNEAEYLKYKEAIESLRPKIEELVRQWWKENMSA